MVIIEGCDNSGKSTLLAKLADGLKLMIVDNRKRPSGTSDISFFNTKMVELSKHFPLILDRHPVISEPVYGPICRGTSWPEPYYQERILGELRAIGVLIVYCRPKDSTILNFGEREQMEGVIKNGVKLIQAYDRQIKFVNQFLEVIHYDYETHDYLSLQKLVETHIKGPIH